jgi:hypothetical protein
VLVQIVAWVVGEYGYLSELGPDEMCNSLVRLMDGIYEDAETTQNFVISALAKIVADTGVKPGVAECLNKYKDSKNLPIQLRCYEIMALLKNPGDMASLLPKDSSMEDIEVDTDLAFLAPFVAAKCAQGAPIYDRAGYEARVYKAMAAGGTQTGQGAEEGPAAGGGGLRFAAYEKAEDPYEVAAREAMERAVDDEKINTDGSGSNFNMDDEGNAAMKDEGGIDTTGVKSVWSLDGYDEEDEEIAPPVVVAPEPAPQMGGAPPVGGDVSASRAQACAP